MNIVVDTNILISALIKEGLTRDLIVNSQFNLLIPEFELIEIQNHKQEIIGKSGLSEEEFKGLLSYLLNYVKAIRTEEIINYRRRAKEIMEEIDPDDVQFIAAAIAYNAAIWSDDTHFQKQNVVKVFTTEEMIEPQK